MKYSVLMTVYKKDNPLYFAEAVESMMRQTVKTDDFVLVCDGELTEELNFEVSRFAEHIRVIRLKANRGLGIALNIGMEHCKYDLIARMDSDDISLSNRCEKQLNFFRQNAELSVLSGSVQEFEGDTLFKKRVLPEKHDELVEWSRKRNPFNHPAVMYRKTAVLKAGGYTEDYHLFEDYDLWVRMLQSGAKGANLNDVLLNMRVSDAMYKRRGGKAYACDLLRFHNHLRNTGWIGTGTFLFCAVPHAVVCMLPNCVRKGIYTRLRES